MEADRCNLIPLADGRWTLMLLTEEEGLHWTFAARDDLEMWLRLALEALLDS